MFMKGDKVFDLLRGKGKVVHVTEGLTSPEAFPIAVQFEDSPGDSSPTTFTSGGREFNSIKTPTLYHGHCAPTICGGEEPIRRPDLEVNAKICIKDTIDDTWKRRHFKRWLDNGRVECWAKGQTSWTTEDSGVWQLWLCPEEGSEC